MPVFQYKYKHDEGYGAGTVEADNEKEAKKIVTDGVNDTVKGVKKAKIKNLKVEITEETEE